jgi:aminomethyltransferase
MTQQTPLHATHVAAGARMVDFGGWDMPVHYGSQVEEHHQVRRDCGVFDVSHMTVVDVCGAQAKAFLRGLLANDVERLQSNGQGPLQRCMLNEQGGVIDDLIVYLTPIRRTAWWSTPAPADKDLAWMQSAAWRHRRGRHCVSVRRSGHARRPGPARPRQDLPSWSSRRAPKLIHRTQAFPGPPIGDMVHRPHRLHR